MTFMSQNKFDKDKETYIWEDENTWELIESIKEDSKEILWNNSESEKESDIFNLIFSDKKSLDTRIKSELGYMWICTKKDLLLIDIEVFSKRYGVWIVMIEHVLNMIDKLKVNIKK